MLALLMSPLIVPLFYFFVVLVAIFLLWVGGALYFFFSRHEIDDALHSSVTRMLYAANFRVYCSSWCCPCRATRTIGDALAPAAMVYAARAQTKRASSRAKQPIEEAAGLAAQAAHRSPLAIAQDFFPLKIPPRTQNLRGLELSLSLIYFLAL